MRGMAALRPLLLFAAIVLQASAALADGDVLLEVDEKRVVRLQGDALANRVEIVPGEGRGVWLIVGTDGTTINGRSQVSVAGAAGIRAVLDAGDDRLEVRGLKLDRHLRMDLGDGDDSAVVRNVVVNGQTTWFGRHGADALTIANGSVFRRSAKFIGDRGRDRITLRDSRMLGSVRIRGNRGGDEITARRMAFEKSARLWIQTGGRADRVVLDTCKLDRDVYITTGNDDDFVLLDDCHVNNDLRCYLGRGNDRANVDDTSFDKDVRIDGESGRDRLDLDGDVKFRGVEKDPERYEAKLRDFERGD